MYTAHAENNNKHERLPLPITLIPKEHQMLKISLRKAPHETTAASSFGGSSMTWPYHASPVSPNRKHTHLKK